MTAVDARVATGTYCPNSYGREQMHRFMDDIMPAFGGA
jgi:hypothetical protein